MPELIKNVVGRNGSAMPGFRLNQTGLHAPHVDLEGNAMDAAIKTLQETRFIRQLQLREITHGFAEPQRVAALESDIADLERAIALLQRELDARGGAKG